MLQEAGEAITSVAMQALGCQIGPSDIMLTADLMLCERCESALKSKVC